MCRVLAYLGRPLSLATVLFETDNSLVRQAHSPRMSAMLSLGLRLRAWEPGSNRPGEPFLYRSTTLPVSDQNLRSLASKLQPTCVLAHVRGVELADWEATSDANLHPFSHPRIGITFAHNGHLREFARMRFALVPHIRPDLRHQIEGTSDSAWPYFVGGVATAAAVARKRSVVLAVEPSAFERQLASDHFMAAIERDVVDALRQAEQPQARIAAGQAVTTLRLS